MTYNLKVDDLLARYGNPNAFNQKYQHTSPISSKRIIIQKGKEAAQASLFLSKDKMEELFQQPRLSSQEAIQQSRVRLGECEIKNEWMHDNHLLRIKSTVQRVGIVEIPDFPATKVKREPAKIDSFDEFIAELREKVFQIKPKEDGAEATFFAVMGQEKKENDLVDEWLETEVLNKLFQGCDEKQEPAMKKLLGALTKNIGSYNTFIVLSRGFQLLATLKEEYSTVSLIGHRIQIAERLFKEKLQALLERKAEFLSSDLDQMHFNKTEVRKSFIDKLQAKKNQLYRWGVASELARQTLIGAAVCLAVYKLYQTFKVEQLPSQDKKTQDELVVVPLPPSEKIVVSSPAIEVKNFSTTSSFCQDQSPFIFMPPQPPEPPQPQVNKTTPSSPEQELDFEIEITPQPVSEESQNQIENNEEEIDSSFSGVQDTATEPTPVEAGQEMNQEAQKPSEPSSDSYWAPVAIIITIVATPLLYVISQVFGNGNRGGGSSLSSTSAADDSYSLSYSDAPSTDASTISLDNRAIVPVAATSSGAITTSRPDNQQQLAPYSAGPSSIGKMVIDQDALAALSNSSPIVNVTAGVRAKCMLRAKILHIHSAVHLELASLEKIFSELDSAYSLYAAAAQDEKSLVESQIITLFLAIIRKINANIQIEERKTKGHSEQPGDARTTDLIKMWQNSMKTWFSEKEKPAAQQKLATVQELVKELPQSRGVDEQKKFQGKKETALNEVKDNFKLIVGFLLSENDKTLLKMELSNLQFFLEDYGMQQGPKHASYKKRILSNEISKELNTASRSNRKLRPEQIDMITLKVKAGTVLQKDKECEHTNLKELLELLISAHNSWCRSSYEEGLEIQKWMIELMKNMVSQINSTIQFNKVDPKDITNTMLMIEQWHASIKGELAPTLHSKAYDILKKVNEMENKFIQINSENTMTPGELSTLFRETKDLLFLEIRKNFKEIVFLCLASKAKCDQYVYSPVEKQTKAIEEEIKSLKKMLNSFCFFLQEYFDRLRWLCNDPELQERYWNVEWFRI